MPLTRKLQAGQNKIQISHLSSKIDTESVRVSGLGQARLFDVVCTIEKEHGADLSSESSSEVIRLLDVKKQGLECQRRVMEHEAYLLVSYAKTLTGEHVTPTAMGEFLKTFVDKATEGLETMADIDKKIVEVNRIIEKESAKALLKIGETNGQVTIVVVATEDSKAEVKLTYSRTFRWYFYLTGTDKVDILQSSVVQVGNLRTSCTPPLRMENHHPLSPFTIGRVFNRAQVIPIFPF